MTRFLLLSLATWLFGACSAPSQALRGPPLEQVLPKALEGVVLLVVQRDDGKVGYGSGVLVNETEVVTSLHVVANSRGLGALAYQPSRQAYTPLDGGLRRYLYEHQEELIDANLVRGDPLNDVALIKLARPVKARAFLKPRAEAPRAGEQVMALGHPKEAVWSFTAGVVSATPLGAVQHDAPINQGNSGGPLIDVTGQLLGINTFKLVGDADGIAFARPWSVVAPLLGQASGPARLDLSSPESALRSCARAMELGDDAFGDCVDFEAQCSVQRQAFESMFEEKKIPDEVRAQVRTVAPGLFEQEACVKQARAATLRWMRTTSIKEALAKEFAEGPLKQTMSAESAAGLRAATEATKTYARQMDERFLTRNGLKVDSSNPSALPQLLKFGRRVDAVNHLEQGQAWALVRGRNADGSEYAYSVALHRTSLGWQEFLADEVLLKALPPGWPPPLQDRDLIRMGFETGFQAAVQGGLAP